MNITTKGENGGKIVGNLHSQGGESATVVSSSLSGSGMPIELENDEVIINRKAVLSNETFEFDGKKMRPCEILSEINEKFGGVKIPCDKVIYSKTKEGIMKNGGIISHYKNERVQIGDYEIDISKIYEDIKLGQVIYIPVSIFNTITENEDKINNIKINENAVIGIFTIINHKPFLIDGNHRTEQLKRNKFEKAFYIYISFKDLSKYIIRKENDKISNKTNKIMEENKKIEEIKNTNGELPFTERETISFGLGGIVESGKLTKITWDEIPEFDKFANNNKVVKWEAEPSNKGLSSIMKNFASNDELRPILNGVYFDNEYIVSTDAHKLIALYSPNNKKEYIDNTYELNSNVKILGKFPNYKVVIPDDFKLEFIVDTDKFKMYVDILQRTKVGDQQIKVIVFNVNNESVGINSSYLSDVLGAIQQLGYRQFLFRYIEPDRPLLFIPDISFKGKDIKGKTTIILLMPMSLEDTNGDIDRNLRPYINNNNVSVFDIEFDRYIESNYNFKKNIVESGGKEYDLDPYTKSNNDDIFSFQEFNYLRNFTSKKLWKSSIIKKAFVKDNNFTVTDLDTTITKKVKGLEDGMYDLEGMMIFKGVAGMDEFPSLNKFGEFSDFANIPIDEMTTNLKYAIPCALEDAFKVLNGIYFEYSNNELIIVSTDSHTIFYNKFNHAEILAKEDKNLIIPKGTVESLNKIIHFTDDINVKISISEKYVKFIIGDYSIIGELIDEKYVDFKRILPDYLNENGYKIIEIKTGEKAKDNFYVKETENTEKPTSKFGLYISTFNEQEHIDLFNIFGKNKTLKAYKERDTLYYITPLENKQTIDYDNISKKKERRTNVSISRKEEEERLDKIRKIENPTVQEKAESQIERINILKEKYSKIIIQSERIKKLKDKYVLNKK